MTTFIRFIYWDEKNNCPLTTPSGRTFIISKEPTQTMCNSQSANWARPISFKKIKCEAPSQSAIDRYENKGINQLITYDSMTYRKLTVKECERLQTLPDDYTAGVSNTQRYRALGNGWTVEVITHIFRGM